MILIRRPVVLAALGGTLSLLATIALIEISRSWQQPTPIAGDPAIYGEMADAILGGAIPYVDVTVEHLPVLLVPILFVGILVPLTSVSYTGLWVLVTIGFVLITVALADRITLVENYQRRFTLVVLPMLPLVIFRLEIYVVLLAILAIGAFAASHYRTGSIWTLLGIVAKGWPIALVGIPLRRKHTALAIAVVGISVAALGIVLSLPGFQQGRSFEGIHSETIVGNIILIYRHLTGRDLGLIGVAGATYVSAPAVAVVANALIALPIIAIAIRTTFRTKRMDLLVGAAGLGVAGIIALSPLFSAQFMFWLVPFVALLSKRGRSAYVVAATLSTALVAFWNPFEAWWAIEVFARNTAFIILVVAWVCELRSELSKATPVPSRAENLA
ncbi:MAG: hypothetical protein BMS9Abin20_0466 [Acidimicrobiia bacterium]|nr:MAG: hypothetical protein BMS9Abin20_0466 [Acidimicrobiia bacterium]